eukprot:TRINITY_DN9326_c0_g3_i2.p1 TRINITY_DN9326_c0_g3~~TRINITY_DN9326_c0_g3_i2.p1  ORF type:complete len:167 (+),score=43.10 TRINITY_DN9326_c0_g3_i2:407-907(+)
MMKELGEVGVKMCDLKRKLKGKTAEFPSFVEDMNVDYLDLFKAEKPAKNNKIKQNVKANLVQENPQTKSKEPINKIINEPAVIPTIKIKAVHKQAQNCKGETFGMLKTTDRLKEIDDNPNIESSSQQRNIFNEKSEEEDNVEEINRKYEQLLKSNLGNNLIVAGKY